MKTFNKIGSIVDSFTGIENDYSRIENFLFSYKTFLINYIDDIINSTYLNEQISLDSYSHSNYFDKIVLYKSKINNFSLRLHIWDKEIHPQIRSDIHDHRWSFMSIVVIGTVIENNYTKISAKGDVDEFNYSINNEKSENFVFKNEAKLLKRYSKVMTKNMIYTKFHNELHDVISNSNYSATLVLRMNPIKSYSSIFVNKGEKIKKEVNKKKMFSESELIQKLVKFRKKIEDEN